MERVAAHIRRIADWLRAKPLEFWDSWRGASRRRRDVREADMDRGPER
jgi:hypothetical protein